MRLRLSFRPMSSRREQLFNNHMISEPTSDREKDLYIGGVFRNSAWGFMNGSGGGFAGLLGVNGVGEPR